MKEKPGKESLGLLFLVKHVKSSKGPQSKGCSTFAYTEIVHNVNIPIDSKPRVVILGGGFGGLQLAKSIKGKGFQVVLLDRHNYHAFQPLFYQVATAGLEPGSICYPFRKIFHHYEDFFFRMAEVQSIDANARIVHTDIGDLSYDHLVIALGAAPNFFNLTNVARLAMPMKSVSDALNIRSLMLQNMEKALLTTDLKEREALMSIIIVGGGPTGVELAGAIAELRKDILPSDYPDLDIRSMDVHLVEANPRVLKEMDEKSSAHALEVLKKMGVDVWLNTRVADYDGFAITTTDQRKLSGAMLIWAAGVKAALPDGLPNESLEGGRIKVDTFNQVSGLERVYAIGDIARMSSDAYPSGHPMVAQPAIQQGRLLGTNLVAIHKGKQPIPFVYKNLGSMATIGRSRAVAEFKSFKLFGWMAWVSWLLVHVYQLIGFRNKLVVMVSWAQNYFRHARDLRLIIRPFKRS
jgi:NADH:ubiquinone reductase (H+-translocating)